jgi:PAS domain S-box-containing protein
MSGETLQHNDLPFHVLIEQSSDAFVLITSEGTITYASPSTARVTGYAPEELVGQNALAFISPDDQGIVIQQFADLLASSGKLPLPQHRLRHRDGSWRWMEGSASNLLHDPAIRAIVCTYRDITERVQLLASEQAARVEAETAQALLRQICVHVPAMIFVLRGPEHRCEFANPLALQKHRRGSLLGKSLKETLPALEAQGFLARLDEVYATGSPCLENEVPLRFDGCVDGVSPVSYYNFICQPLRAADGAVNGLSVYVVEVTDQVRMRRRLEAEKEALRLAEQQARTQANQLAAVFEAMTDAVVVCDSEGWVKRANSAFRALFDLEADPDLVRFLPNASGMGVIPYDQGGNPLFQVLRREHLSDPQAMDLCGRSRTGRELFFNVRGAPIRDDAGQVVGGIAVYRDVTQRHQLEEQLQYAERKFRSLIDSNIIAVMVTDKEGRIYEVNDHLVQSLGYSREELLDGTMRVKDLLVPAYREARTRAWKTLVSQGSSLPEEKIYVSKNGRHLSMLVVAATINQERSRALVMLLDISDYKEAQQRKQEFLTMVNHELRTPLTVIQGMVEVSLLHLANLPTDSPVSEDAFGKINTPLQQTLRQVEIETRLVAELLDVSRIEMQKFELCLRECDLASLVTQVVANQQQVVSTHRIELMLPSLPAVAVIADADRIEQVLTNFLTNAFRYSPADAVVSVRLDLEGAMARVAVHDQGAGLSPEQQVRVWERFYQTGTTRGHAPDEGLGLGLYIVRTIIAQHQGQVGVESRPGQGTTFWFMLPLTDEPVQV